MTIFENLVYNENTFTELFKNIMKFKVFRREFLSLIDYDFSVEDIEFENFSTQKTTDNGRPDLIISTQTIEIYIEIKVWNTILTSNQPSGYLKELEGIPKSKKMLILLTPKNYKYLDIYDKRKSQDNSNIKTQTIFWSEIIYRIEQEEIFEGNPLLNEYLELLKEWFEPKHVEIDNKFLEIMYNIDTPSSLEKLTDLINQVKTELQKSGVEITSNKTNILNEYGFYCDSIDSYSLYIGEWFDYWKETGNPFCIAIHTNNEQILNQFNIECKQQGFTKPELFENTNWWVCNISLKINESTIEIITDKTKKIIDKLKNTTLQHML
ncbi:MAG: hypothetical protein VR77_11760 [Flavobacteriales bacterium BRH_c54]|nr:MAG: hypothetical protein VR77_11760 [Flavobacteriales bacterium BRH_c54]